MKKKTNPRKRPVTKADIKRAEQVALDEATEICLCMVFTVLRDKEGYAVDDLRRVYSYLNDLADSMDKGYINVADLRYALKEEGGIEFC